MTQFDTLHGFTNSVENFNELYCGHKRGFGGAPQGVVFRAATEKEQEMFDSLNHEMVFDEPVATRNCDSFHGDTDYGLFNHPFLEAGMPFAVVTMRSCYLP